MCDNCLIYVSKKSPDNKNNKKEGEKEGFENNIRPLPEPEDPEDKRYKPVLKQNVKDLCNRPSKDYCLPYKINEVPDKRNNDSIFDLENNNNNKEINNFLHCRFRY